MKISLSSDNLAKAHWLTPRSHVLPCLSVEQLRCVELAAFSQIESWTLMEAAGKRAARKVLDLLQHQPFDRQHCVVLAGPGNNGGDAFVLAAELANHGIDVQCAEHAGAQSGSADRQKAREMCLQANVQIIHPSQMKLQNATIVVDGLLGIGCSKAPEGEMLEAITAVNTARSMGHLPGGHPRLKVISLDCPSGLDCTTGLCLGEAIVADQTLTFIALKHGLLSNHGRDHCGEIYLDTLGCDELITQYMSFSTRTDKEHQHRLPVRGHQHHKGSFGSLAIIGGDAGMVGAILLAARTAILLGSGRVAITLLAEASFRQPDVQIVGNLPFVDLQFPELMNKDFTGNLDFADCILAGPGLGMGFEARQWLQAIIEQPESKPLTLDADALNLIASDRELSHTLKQRRLKANPDSLIITPHPLEAARLLGTTPAQINQDRLLATKSLAEAYNCTVVLKGSGSIIANPKDAIINTTGGPALATAGSGDVLAGAIAAFVAQGLSGFHAAACATWLHGLTTETMYFEPEATLVSHASEISQKMHRLLNSMLNKRACGNG